MATKKSATPVASPAAIRRTRHLSHSLTDLVIRGKRDPRAVNAVLQRLIDDTPSNYPNRLRGVIPPRLYRRMVNQLQPMFKRDRNEVIDLLAPIFTPNPTFRPAPAPADLEHKLRAAMPWLTFERVRTFTYAELDDVWSTEIKVIHDTPLLEDFDDFWRDSRRMSKELRDRLERYRYDVIWPRLTQKFKDAAVQATSPSRAEELFGELGYDETLFDTTFELYEYEICTRAYRWSDPINVRSMIDLIVNGTQPYTLTDGTLYVLTA